MTILRATRCLRSASCHHYTVAILALQTWLTLASLEERIEVSEPTLAHLSMNPNDGLRVNFAETYRPASEEFNTEIALEALCGRRVLLPGVASVPTQREDWLIYNVSLDAELLDNGCSKIIVTEMGMPFEQDAMIKILNS